MTRHSLCIKLYQPAHVTNVQLQHMIAATLSYDILKTHLAFGLHFSLGSFIEVIY